MGARYSLYRDSNEPKEIAGYFLVQTTWFSYFRLISE